MIAAPQQGFLTSHLRKPAVSVYNTNNLILWLRSLRIDESAKRDPALGSAVASIGSGPYLLQYSFVFPITTAQPTSTSEMRRSPSLTCQERDQCYDNDSFLQSRYILAASGK
jgi:hypothetical protein